MNETELKDLKTEPEAIDAEHTKLTGNSIFKYNSGWIYQG